MRHLNSERQGKIAHFGSVLVDLWFVIRDVYATAMPANPVVFLCLLWQYKRLQPIVEERVWFPHIDNIECVASLMSLFNLEKEPLAMPSSVGVCGQQDLVFWIRNLRIQALLVWQTFHNLRKRVHIQLSCTTLRRLPDSKLAENFRVLKLLIGDSATCTCRSLRKTNLFMSDPGPVPPCQ